MGILPFNNRTIAIPEQLSNLLENPDVVKTGVGIQNDMKKLYNDHKLSAKNCVGLSLLARSVDNAQWKGKYNSPLGLARLIEAYEDCTLQKGRITRSNWEAFLTRDQQEYAANDAHAGYTLYTILHRMTASMTIVPESVCYTFDYINGRFCEPSGRLWHPYNQDYDPGPPPPPRPPKIPSASNVVDISSTTDTDTSTVNTDASSSSFQSNLPDSALSFGSGPGYPSTNVQPKNRQPWRPRAQRLGGPAGATTGHHLSPALPAAQLDQVQLPRHHTPPSSSGYQYPRGLPRTYRPRRGPPF
ncbi:hypothetical protein HGRIS_007582 [Hohenbuehelia grisea]|uniref:3'-5' exonuclease n=1 Tax=Hohenbuehelia grisea TaxID=104357 RepID=A0ABR3J5B0_9AGAR